MQPELHEAKRQLLSRRQVLSLRIPAHKSEERTAQDETESAAKDVASTPEATQRLAILTLAEERELDEIDAALLRIDTRRYGTCETCERAISANRLRAVPQARLCMDCSADLRGERR